MSDLREAGPTESGSSQFHLKKKRQSASDAEHGFVGPRPPQQAHIHTVSQVPLPPYQKLANPGPLGLLGFALTTFVLGLHECGAGLPHSNPQTKVGPNQAAFGLAIFMGGGAQFVAGIFEFRVGNTFGCTVHCSYAAFWLSYAMFLIPSLDIKGQYNEDERAYSFAIDIYLIVWCFLTVLFLIAALRNQYIVANFIATEYPEHSVRVNKAGGAFTVICAFVAFYAGSSGLMVPETTFVRFPLGEIA
ncbi:acetate uptake transporter family protein [Aspergillus alliaceus]|uniref:acetate uptake transporter family protein n=1 Tax=Petromyces alliaceus TaxID=209559 RepID=UPI0012A47F6A|nr:GPR1/FUN34/yaaH family-domain-containing protein [Aspergillus alliaceus]KAB8227290.1 GPR1/FUN34/yaaH family-domain-containing protein [Aspergillus alliaceus]